MTKKTVENKVDYEHFSFDSMLTNLTLDGIHCINEDSNPYHICINNITTEVNAIIIGFTGAIQRNGTSPPYFSFRKISKSLNLGLISISDPSLNLASDLRLSWYVGNNINGDVALKLAQFLDKVVLKTEKKIILCGGSGGGFAALNIQSLMLNKKSTVACVWNPQTDITKYHNSVLFKYLSSCYNFTSESLSEARSFLLEKNIRFEVKVDKSLDGLIMINGYDPNHIRKHVRKFIHLDDSSSTYVYFGDWGNGHVPPDTDLIKNVILELSSGKSAKLIGEKLFLNISNKDILLFALNGKKLEKVLKVTALSIKINNRNMILLRSNIIEFFMGYNISIILRHSKKILYNSGYLVGADAAEILLEILPISNMKNHDIDIELLIEDILGVQKKYYYNLAEININKKLKKQI